MANRQGRGVFRYNDDEWKQAQERKQAEHTKMPFATWLRKLSLNQLEGSSGASQGYLKMLQETRSRAVAEALAWRKINALLGLPEGSPPAVAEEKIRTILDD